MPLPTFRAAVFAAEFAVPEVTPSVGELVARVPVPCCTRSPIDFASIANDSRSSAATALASSA